MCHRYNYLFFCVIRKISTFSPIPWVHARPRLIRSQFNVVCLNVIFVVLLFVSVICVILVYVAIIYICIGFRHKRPLEISLYISARKNSLLENMRFEWMIFTKIKLKKKTPRDDASI